MSDRIIGASRHYLANVETTELLPAMLDVNAWPIDRLGLIHRFFKLNKPNAYDPDHQILLPCRFLMCGDANLHRTPDMSAVPTCLRCMLI